MKIFKKKLNKTLVEKNGLNLNFLPNIDTLIKGELIAIILQHSSQFVDIEATFNFFLYIRN